MCQTKPRRQEQLRARPLCHDLLRAGYPVRGFPCSYDGYKALEQRSWVRVTAKVSYKFHNIYRGKGPVLTAISVEPAEKPLNEVVTFS